jgi:hypothetical protein
MVKNTKMILVSSEPMDMPDPPTGKREITNTGKILYRWGN